MGYIRDVFGLAYPGIKPGDHGHPTTYAYWACRCKLCTQAHAAKYWWERSQRVARGRIGRNGKWNAPVDLPPNGPWRHGVYTTAQGWDCHCDPCAAALRDFRNNYYHRRGWLADKQRYQRRRHNA